jgi:hypothetical protein
MAKKKHKPEPAKKPVVKKKKELTESDLIALEAPNLMGLPTLYEDSDSTEEIYPPDLTTSYTDKQLNSDVPGSEFWKLLRLAMARWSMQRLLVEDKAGKRRPAFIDSRYEIESTPIGGLAPPTWMDPEIFIRAALADKEIQNLMKLTADATNLRQKASIEARLQVLFDTKYKEYIQKQFADIKGLMARWLIARAVWMKDDTKKTKKKAVK